MKAHQTAKTTLLFTLSFLVLFSIVVGASSGRAAQAGTNKPNQVTNPVSQAPTTPPTNSKGTGTASQNAAGQNVKDSGTTPATRPQWSVEEGITAFGFVFVFMAGVLVLIVVLLTIALVHISSPGARQWSLGDALSEESSVQPPAGFDMAALQADLKQVAG